MSTNNELNLRFRVRLSDLLLLTAAIAILLAHFRVRQELASTQSSVSSMRRLARELVVDDESMFAAVSRSPTLPGETLFDVFVPQPPETIERYELCLNLEAIVDFGSYPAELKFPKPIDRVPITPGRHSIEVRHHEPDSTDPAGKHVIEILLDDQAVMNGTRDSNWKPSGGYTSYGSMTETRQFQADAPVQLHRRRFNEPIKGGGSRSAPGDQPVNGVLLWIRPNQ